VRATLTVCNQQLDIVLAGLNAESYWSRNALADGTAIVNWDCIVNDPIYNAVDIVVTTDFVRLAGINVDEVLQSIDAYLDDYMLHHPDNVAISANTGEILIDEFGKVVFLGEYA